MRSATEIENAVREIGLDIYRLTDGIEYLDISFRANGFHQEVIFCDIVLWSSETEMEGNSILPIELVLRRRLDEELRKLEPLAFVNKDFYDNLVKEGL